MSYRTTRSIGVRIVCFTVIRVWQDKDRKHPFPIPLTSLTNPKRQTRTGHWRASVTNRTHIVFGENWFWLFYSFSRGPSYGTLRIRGRCARRSRPEYRLKFIIIIVFLGNFGAKKCVKPPSTNALRSSRIKFSPVSSPSKSGKSSHNKCQNHNAPSDRRRSSDAKEARTVYLNEYDHSFIHSFFFISLFRFRNYKESSETVSRRLLPDQKSDTRLIKRHRKT